MADKYLFKRGLAYYSRFTIPHDYRIFFNAQELRWSLKTSCEKLARERVHAHRQIFLSALQKVHNMEQTFDLTLDEMKQIQESLSAYLQEQLRLFRGFSSGTTAEREQAKEILAEKSDRISLYQEALKKQDYTDTNGPLSDFLQYPAMQRLAMMFDVPSENFRWFAELACTTELKLYQRQRELLNGSQREESTFKQSTPSNSKHLSTVIELYLDEKTNKGLTEKTLQNYRTTFDRLVDYLDDPLVDSIERKHLVQYQKALELFPSAALTPEQRETPFKELIAGHHEKTLSKSSINKYMTRCSELFAWLVRTDKHFTHNPAAGLVTKDPRRSHEERSEFTGDQMKIIFEGIDIFQGKRACSKSAHYWAPLIAAYSGMRIEEICQLDTADVRQEDGIWVFDVNNNNDKRLKTKAAQRLIPIHSALLALGILEYLGLVSKGGHTKLFPTLPQCKTNGYSHNPGKWFSRQKAKLGLKGTTEVFHSFRHSVSNVLKQSQVEPEIADQITGHADASLSEGRKRYAKPYTVKTLREAIEKIHHPISVVKFQDIKLASTERRDLNNGGKTTAKSRRPL